MVDISMVSEFDNDKFQDNRKLKIDRNNKGETLKKLTDQMNKLNLKIDQKLLMIKNEYILCNDICQFKN